MSAANNTHGAGCILWPIGIYLVVDWSPSETKQYKVAHEMLTRSWLDSDYRHQGYTPACPASGHALVVYCV